MKNTWEKFFGYIPYDKEFSINQTPEVTYQENSRDIPEEMVRDEMMELYPEIYRILNPMVEKICTENREERVTKDLVERLSNEIYTNIEDTTNITDIQANPSMDKPMKEEKMQQMQKMESRVTPKTQSKPHTHMVMNTKKSPVNSYIGNPYKNNRSYNKNSMTTKQEAPKKETVVENRAIRPRRDPIMKDLIRILILNSLLNNRPPHPGPGPGPRPPIGPGFPPPIRPPHPGPGPGPRPPQPGPRPPVGPGPRPPRPMHRDFDGYYNFE